MGVAHQKYSAKCEELIREGKECEPVCLSKTKPAGWGRARSPGFDRISLENVMCREGNTATWQLWLAILALYLGHWAAYRIVDAHDEEATETIRAAAEDAPPHHYAVATTGLPEHLRARPRSRRSSRASSRCPARRARRAVPPPERDARGGEGRGRRAAAAGGRRAAAAAPATPRRPPRGRRARSSSSRPPARRRGRRGGRGAPRVPEGQGRARRSSCLFGGDGGARGRVQAFCEALKEVERADWRQALHERWEGKERQRFQRGCAKCIDGCICCCSFVGRKIQNQAASPADARRRCEEARKAVADHAAGASSDGGSAIVIFSSLESAEAAATCPLGAPAPRRGRAEADVPRGQAAPETGKAQPLDRRAGDGGILLNGRCRAAGAARASPRRWR